MCGSTKQVVYKEVWDNTHEWGRLLGLVGSSNCYPPTAMCPQHPTCAHWQKCSLHMTSYAKPSSDCCLCVCTNDHNAHPFPTECAMRTRTPPRTLCERSGGCKGWLAHLAQPPPLWPAVAGRHTGRGSGRPPTGAAPALWAPSRAASPTGAPPSRTQPPPQPAPARTLCST